MSERLRRNQQVIDEFRSSAGVVGGDFDGVPLLLLTSTGARTGLARTMPMTYLRDADRLVVFAANGGRPQHPAWFHNLLTHPVAHVEVGTESFDAAVTVLDGETRRRLWTEQLKHTPYFAGFQEKSGREIPVIALARAS
ncbi:MAG TPA: nitroreductase/quinone reductase family protein [Stackebrandtia sp.]|jgi:deazaflavin-dependent oxidoreductase (nitroreductase family)|uniref:nitroreductase/quinone reductase family protein n=1 Tax=Stackebrandtia sp. TaxID=2023065 RepID=UPI002D358CEB|nr:nitroreductase/quinone reductase family protein [Stackebrandtia sp.]HZE37382.1 nitroreductase/quinone reductase family protein [Stackebrandtia sp.]